MKLNKIDKFILAILVISVILLLAFMKQLTMFQYVLLVQILPATLLALFWGRLASVSKLKWVMFAISGIVFSLFVFGVVAFTPMDIIEKNTVQSATSVIEFNRDIRPITYVGLFLQEFIMTGFVAIIAGIVNRIKGGKF